ncbi:MAG: lytic transglycosylase domain-containing protein [Ruminococcaceae bacterium]|nr:lytic transglycosylase domain-containing protein [Oscillospiraceae bacterium]
MLIVLRKKRIVTTMLVAAVVLAIVFGTMPILHTLFPLRHREWIDTYSEKYGLDPYLVMGVISAESRFEESAVSHKDARGLMQITGETAAWCIGKFDIPATAEQIHLPEVNIQIGCAYLDYLMETFDGQTQTVLAAYNAGQGNVRKWLADVAYSADGKTLHTIPFEETRTYVDKVIKRMEIYRRLYAEETYR